MQMRATWAALVGIVVGVGCWRRAEHHCSNLEGDATCAERGGGAFCDICRAEGDGCTDARPSQTCHFAGPEPAGTTIGTSGPGSTITTTITTASTSLETTTIADGTPEPATTGAACASDDDCSDPAAPFCAPDRAECVACDAMPAPDAACAERDESAPVCADGACVQCSATNDGACEEMLRICDVHANACAPCTEHEQCASGACELADGRCFPPDAIALVVDGSGGEGYASVGAAVAAIPDGGTGIVRVHAQDGGAAYQGAPVIDGGKTVALLAAPGEAPVLRGTLGGTPALRVEGSGTTLYLDGLGLRGTTAGPGLVASEATAWIDRSRIVQNAGGGVRAEDGAVVTIRSSFVGGSVEDVVAVEVIDATARIAYATIGAGPGDDARALVCDGAVTVVVRNSVLVAQTSATAIDCVGTFGHDATEDELGGTNTAVGPMSTSWFAGYGQGHFGLTLEGAEVFADVARWEPGDPREDIDGDPRPTIAGAPDHAGADVP